MKREEANGDRIRPGDVYEYSCSNDQGYGYMIPVKTSSGWDFIDTYQLDIPSRKDGETGDDASIRRIIELGDGEHDGYVSRATSTFYHRNAHFRATAVPFGLRLAFNLNDYNSTSSSECENYDDSDVVYYVPLYREQHYSWNLGRTLGLCFVRKGAEKSPVNEFRSLLREASNSIVSPCVGRAASLLSRIEEKLREIVAFDLDGNFDGVANSLADLIDRPTCRIILARELRTAYGKPITGINGYILSCGHQAVGFEKPRYCPECGMEVGE